VQGHVRDRVQAQAPALVRDFHVVDRIVKAGGGVHVSARGLDALGRLARTELLGALEDHVFQQMADARLGRIFVGRAGAHVKPHIGQGETVVALDEHGQAVFQADHMRAVAGERGGRRNIGRSRDGVLGVDAAEGHEQDSDTEKETAHEVTPVCS
jgi:hypothetical protein